MVPSGHHDSRSAPHALMNPSRRDFQRTLRNAVAEVANEAFPNDPHGVRKVQLTPRLRAEAVKRARARTRGATHE